MYFQKFSSASFSHATRHAHVSRAFVAITAIIAFIVFTAFADVAMATCLGLALVRSFVELHGGRVVVDSVLGRGTSVTCEFPIEHTAQRNAAE